MANITFDNQTFTSQDGETVLETLLRAGQTVPYSCRQGLCQSCLMRCTDKTPPAHAQTNLKDTLQQQNYFLSCLCLADKDMTVALPSAEDNRSFQATVYKKQTLAEDIVRLVLRVEDSFSFYAGQFVQLQRADGLTRSYSIANIPRFDSRLEFHIRRLPQGQFSNWVFDRLQVGDTLSLSSAQGDCYYSPTRQKQPLLLIGTGTGLAPLYGIVYDALMQDHQAEIHLYHGSQHANGLYLVEQLQQLAVQFPQFTYVPCVSRQQRQGFAFGRANDVAFQQIKQLKGWCVYLCGHPEMVQQSKLTAYLQGAALKDIYADEFVVHAVNPSQN